MQLIDAAPLMRFPQPLKLRWHERVLHFKKPAAIFEDACGKFDPNFFTDYLTEKYSGIYGL